MARISLIFGSLLIALGVVAFLLAGATAKSITALIPAFIGLILLLLSAIARKSQAANKHAMHVAALLGLIGTLGGFGMGIPKLIKYLGGDESIVLRAPVVQITMGILCAMFLVMCVRSFIAARRARLAA
ncbi:hypothetical protein FEM03_05235 [Phragmitibacter flavus]|uniref:MotA/TolQ/ExbB proton channel domain-containing protein n=1 Tax=Phragmitibacter flavus TaxID=2576071 RepID=A0A5R8KKI8_9BACT|nr:hypothetical protein [Phragmitibacter flavus]TLD72129.1 hypothetical protein FEM03_05235 [Phragmitibacter flavus]